MERKMKQSTLLVVVMVFGVATAGVTQTAPAPSRLGINLSAVVDWGSELPFVDLFRLSRPWISQQQGASWGGGPGLHLDEHGWVRRLARGTWAETLMLTREKGVYPGGPYVVLYDGEGRVELTGIRQVLSSAPGRIVFEPQPATGFTLQLRETNPSNYVRNIRVLLPGSEGTYRDNPWNSSFLQRWSGLATLRFMDWMMTNDTDISDWNQRPTLETATFSTSGVPIELMVDLANRLGASPWFTLPHQASDDYVRRFAQLVRASLRRDLKPYIEYSNEIWNFGFPQTHFAADRGVALGLASQPWEAAWRYSARRSVEIFRIWEQVYGGTGGFVRVMASQAANSYIAEVKLGFEDAYRSVDALAIAPYLTLNLSSGSSPTAAAVARWSPDRVIARLNDEGLPEAREWVIANREVANSFGVRLIAYEGGQHAVGIDGAENNAALAAVLQAANRSERMGALYSRYLDMWLADGGGDLFCLFSSVEVWSGWGSWGLLETLTDDTPKFRAVLAWNRAHPR